MKKFEIDNKKPNYMIYKSIEDEINKLHELIADLKKEQENVTIEREEDE